MELAIKILHQELKITMALAGYAFILYTFRRLPSCLHFPARCRSVSEINKSHLSVIKSDGVLAKL